MQYRHLVWIALPVAVACATNSVKPIAETRTPAPRPPVVLVYDPLFQPPGEAQNASTVGHLVNTHDDYPHGDLGKHAAHVFAGELVNGISKLGLHAERAGRDTPVPENAVIIVGQLIAVHKGSNATRLVVGFGAGESVVDMRVHMYAVGDGPVEVLEIEARADSGKLPGTAITMGAGAAATGGLTVVGGAAALVGGGIKTYRYAVEQLAKRSANHTTEYMSQYFAREGWIAQNRVKKPSPTSHVLDVY